MTSSNSNITVASGDFNNIKQQLINYLQSQTTFQDYNFPGSGLSILMDILGINTQFGAFFVNMAANEMFMDTCLQLASGASMPKN